MEGFHYFTILLHLTKKKHFFLQKKSGIALLALFVVCLLCISRPIISAPARKFLPRSPTFCPNSHKFRLLFAKFTGMRTNEGLIQSSSRIFILARQFVLSLRFWSNCAAGITFAAIHWKGVWMCCICIMIHVSWYIFLYYGSYVIFVSWFMCYYFCIMIHVLFIIFVLLFVCFSFLSWFVYYFCLTIYAWLFFILCMCCLPGWKLMHETPDQTPPPSQPFLAQVWQWWAGPASDAVATSPPSTAWAGAKATVCRRGAVTARTAVPTWRTGQWRPAPLDPPGLGAHFGQPGRQLNPRHWNFEVRRSAFQSEWVFWLSAVGSHAPFNLHAPF